MQVLMQCLVIVWDAKMHEGMGSCLREPLRGRLSQLGCKFFM